MKYLGITLVTAGIIITIFSGITFQRDKEVAEIGDYEITRLEEQTVTWPGWVGGGVVVVGVVILLVGRRR